MASEWDFLPNDWSDPEKGLWADAFEPIGAFNDPHAQALFNAGYFDEGWSRDERAAIREELSDYLMDAYGVDFDEVFDWEAWREAYGAAG
jgi:hypothetical protein